jgi:gamma-glutamylcyclotransferase (GGCT)/AIG2-like uncharacterized protein YtfP
VKADRSQPGFEVGETYHANVVFVGGAAVVAGMVLEVTDAELAGIDEYERVFDYARIVAQLASGRTAWVYRHVESK